MAELDRLIQSLYTTAIEGERADFRVQALREVCEWLGASGAAWLTRSGGGLPGEYAEFPAAGITLEQLMALHFNDGEREHDLDPLPRELSPGGKASGLEQGHVLHYAHRGGGLHSVVLIRMGRSKKLQHRAELSRAIGHMIEAGALSLRQFIQRDEWLFALGRPSRGTAALVDASGTIYAASKRFLELLATEFGERSYTALPQPLPEDARGADGLFFQGSLHFRSARRELLYLLHARRPLPLDGLSPREQEIARALGTGKTFKSVARQFGIAVSTVANHASRIYRKLGIFRREELVEMVRTPTN